MGSVALIGAGPRWGGAVTRGTQGGTSPLGAPCKAGGQLCWLVHSRVLSFPLQGEGRGRKEQPRGPREHRDCNWDLRREGCSAFHTQTDCRLCCLSVQSQTQPDPDPGLRCLATTIISTAVYPPCAFAQGTIFLTTGTGEMANAIPRCIIFQSEV